MANFYSRLSYSFGNEDWNTEQKALHIQPSDRVLCVTASGDRPLNLMTTKCRELVAIDANPFQTALFDLKKTALTHLPYDEYLAFLGLRTSSKRISTYQALMPYLASASKSVLNLEQKKIKKGILFEGATEKCLKIASYLLKFWRGKKINRLFSFDNLEDQVRFIENEFDSPMWRKAFHFALHPKITRLILKDPGLYQHIDPNIHIGNHIYNRMHAALKQFLAKESILATLILKGKVTSESNLPPYLSQSGVQSIKQQINSLSFKSIDLISYLEQAPDNYFDCFSLSDVASYISGNDFDRMIRALQRVAKPKARFCIRQFLSNHQIPEKYSSFFQRDILFEKELEKEDRCFVYRFMTGTILKNPS